MSHFSIVRRRIMITIVLCAVLAGAIWFFLYQRSRPIQVTTSQLIRLELVSFPEGPPGPLFERNPGVDSKGGPSYPLPLSFIDDLIPLPLPAPVWQGFGCDSGGNLVIDLVNGDTITYGPCRRPSEIQHLWNEVVKVWNEEKSKQAILLG